MPKQAATWSPATRSRPENVTSPPETRVSDVKITLDVVGPDMKLQNFARRPPRERQENARSPAKLRTNSCHNYVAQRLVASTCYLSQLLVATTCYLLAATTCYPSQLLVVTTCYSSQAARANHLLPVTVACRSCLSQPPVATYHNASVRSSRALRSRTVTVRPFTSTMPSSTKLLRRRLRLSGVVASLLAISAQL